jgi:hypothetical protein
MLDEIYRHTQCGTVIVSTIGLAVAVTAAASWDVAAAPTLAAVAFLVLCVLLFGTLTVGVSRSAVTIRFGIRLIRRTFKVREIRAVQVVRNQWFFGWGIRRLWRGWLYNVSGLSAVEIELADGSAHRIGTDEPEALAGAIARARGLAS